MNRSHLASSLLSPIRETEKDRKDEEINRLKEGLAGNKFPKDRNDDLGDLSDSESPIDSGKNENMYEALDTSIATEHPPAEAGRMI